MKCSQQNALVSHRARSQSCYQSHALPPPKPQRHSGGSVSTAQQEHEYTWGQQRATCTASPPLNAARIFITSLFCPGSCRLILGPFFLLTSLSSNTSEFSIINLQTLVLVVSWTCVSLYRHKLSSSCMEQLTWSPILTTLSSTGWPMTRNKSFPGVCARTWTRFKEVVSHEWFPSPSYILPSWFQSDFQNYSYSFSHFHQTRGWSCSAQVIVLLFSSSLSSASAVLCPGTILNAKRF